LAPARAVAAGLVVAPQPASGQALSYFKVPVRPGHSARAGVIALRNPTGATLRVVLSAVDGRTIDTLGSTYAPGASRGGPASWLGFGRRVVTLAPHQSALVPVSVSAPRGARGGDYLAGVSAEIAGEPARASSAHGVSIASALRYVIGVEMSTPGRRHHKIRFTGARLQRQPAGLTFLLLAVNDGNTILQGVRGGVRIERNGRTVLSRALGPGTFVTASGIAYPVPAFGERPREGTRYRIRAILRYAGGIARLDTTVGFGHREAVAQQQYGGQRAATGGGTSWWKAALLALAIAYGLVTTILLLRRRRRREPSPG
jgi:hypothetical protein